MPPPPEVPFKRIDEVTVWRVAPAFKTMAFVAPLGEVVTEIAPVVALTAVEKVVVPVPAV